MGCFLATQFPALYLVLLLAEPVVFEVVGDLASSVTWVLGGSALASSRLLSESHCLALLNLRSLHTLIYGR